jgi:hypothetical protein
MLPLNTVPITAEELQGLNSKGIILTIWVYYLKEWNLRLNTFHIDNLSAYKFRIAAHDYRHYFGEVVDLASKLNDGYLTYLGSDFKYDNDYDELTYCIREVSTSLTQFEGTEPECKQWLIDHFTAIAAKDLPNYNLKFIFS